MLTFLVDDTKLQCTTQKAIYRQVNPKCDQIYFLLCYEINHFYISSLMWPEGTLLQQQHNLCSI